MGTRVTTSGLQTGVETRLRSEKGFKRRQEIIYNRTMSQSKGDRRERELVNRLDDAEFAVMRAPASGSATERELPDVLAGNGDQFYAFEAKSSSGDPIYITEEKVEGLVYFAKNYRAVPTIGARFDREPWYFLHPSWLHRTPSGNYRVKLETAEEQGLTLDELAEENELTAEV